MRATIQAIALLGAAALTVTVPLAQAHGPAEWIARGAYKNAAGELCCGPSDCVELSAAEVRVVKGGYRLIATQEFIPNAEASPGEAQQYFICRWGGQRKCFFFPANGA